MGSGRVACGPRALFLLRDLRPSPESQEQGQDAHAAPNPGPSLYQLLVSIQSASVDRQGMPFEETPRRLWFRRVPGRGLGRLYGTVLPFRGGVATDAPATSRHGKRQYRCVETPQSLTGHFPGPQTSGRLFGGNAVSIKSKHHARRTNRARPLPHKERPRPKGRFPFDSVVKEPQQATASGEKTS